VILMRLRIASFIVGADLALVHVLAQDPGDVGQPLFGKLNLDVAHDDVQAGGGGHLSDAVAHLARSDNPKSVDFHFLTPLLGV
jgi:hypothetical protein